MSTVATYPAGLIPVGFQQLTVSSDVIDLIVPPNALRAVLGVESQPLRYRVDGAYPTTSVGFLVKADVTFELNGPLALKSFRAIRSTGSDATLNVIFYGERGEVALETTTTTAETTTTTTGG